MTSLLSVRTRVEFVFNSNSNERKKKQLSLNTLYLLVTLFTFNTRTQNATIYKIVTHKIEANQKTNTYTHWLDSHNPLPPNIQGAYEKVYDKRKCVDKWHYEESKHWKKSNVWPPMNMTYIYSNKFTSLKRWLMMLLLLLVALSTDMPDHFMILTFKGIRNGNVFSTYNWTQRSIPMETGCSISTERKFTLNNDNNGLEWEAERHRESIIEKQKAKLNLGRHMKEKVN